MATNGAHPSNNGGDSEVLSRIHQALEVVYSRDSTNESRRQAQNFLQEAKEHSEAPMQGFGLASNKAQSPIVRHYALSLLEHAIRYKWSAYTNEQAVAIRDWVVQLAQAVASDDPSYLRSKVAQLWVEVAKRCWGTEWMDMDSMLVQLWQVQESAVHKELVLSILETLSEDIFNGDDPTIALRERYLSKGCIDIFTPSDVLRQVFPSRMPGPDVRHGQEGWITRLSDFLHQCIQASPQGSPEVVTCAVKTLSTILSLIPWAIPKAIAAANCVAVLTSGLSSAVPQIQKGSLDALHALYTRTNLEDADFTDLVVPMYRSNVVQLCRQLYEYSQVDAEDIDEDKYQILKKLSEMLSRLAEYFQSKYELLPANAASDEFFQLLLQVSQNQSLMVSIPIMVVWSRLLPHSKRSYGGLLNSFHAPLLELSMDRLVRYEYLPEDSTDPRYIFLMEDTDTIPERHAFLGNYRRYTCRIIESIVHAQPFDSMAHILSSVESVLRQLYQGQPSFDKNNYSKHSPAALQVDSHFTVIEAAIKGYMKRKKIDSQLQESAGQMEQKLEAWCHTLLDMSFEDPAIRKRKLQLLVHIATTGLDSNTDLMLKVLEHILVTWPALEPDYRAYNDAIKDLQGESMVELQRLATDMPDTLLQVFDQIETRVNEMMSSGSLDEKRSLAYKSFLFLIIHRASSVDTQTKVNSLRRFIDPVKASWQEPTIRASLGSFSGFCQSLGLDKAQDYLTRRNAHQIPDWGQAELDEEGLALQNELEEKMKVLPLRPTKAFLAFSVERLDKSSEAFKASYQLWQEGFSSILADLLEYLRFAHACHNPENWLGLSNDTRSMVDRLLSDRFWQAGISEGSKDDFYARVVDKKRTLEGIASTIRGSVRFVRETGYAIIYCMSRLEMQFYGFEGLAQPLSQALFADSTWLSTHQQSNLLHLMRYLVDDCPVKHRETFLPQLMNVCFRQIDAKINGEWEKLGQQQNVIADGDDELKEEMKAESILRQVTYTAVVMVADFLDPSKESTPESGSNSTELATADSPGSLRRFCLTHQEIAEPMLVFCTHVIRMRDTRCSSLVLRLFLSLVPEFQHGQSATPRKPPTSPAAMGSSDHGTDMMSEPVSSEMMTAIREYISTEVLKACITSFHDGHFVDVQKELAALIAAILVYYSPVTATPKNILLQLPNINPAELQRLEPYMEKPASHSRQQRAIVLELLKDLKGVSLSEMGKLSTSHHHHQQFGNSGGGDGRGKRAVRTKMAQQFMTDESAQQPQHANSQRGRQATPEALDSVSHLFGN